MITDDQLLSSPTIREALGRMRGVGLDKIAGVPTLEAAVLDLTTKFAYALLKQARITNGLRSAEKLAGRYSDGLGTTALLGAGGATLGAIGGYDGAESANPDGAYYDRIGPAAAGALGGAVAVPVGAVAGGALGLMGGALAHRLGAPAWVPGLAAVSGAIPGAVKSPHAVGKYIGEKTAGLQNEGYYTGLQMGVLPGVLGGIAGASATPEGADHGHAFLQGAGGGTIGGLVGGTAGYMLGRPFGMGAATGMGLAGALGLGAYAGHNAGKAYPLSTEDVDAQLAAIEGGKSAPLLRSEAPRAVDEDAEVAKIATILGNTFKRAPKATPAAAPAAAAGELPEFIRNFKPAPPPAKAPVERTMSVTSTPKPIQAFDPHELQANAFLARLKPASGTPDGPFRLSNMKGRTVTAALQIPGSIMRGGLAGAGVGAVGGAVGAGEGNRMQGALGGAATGAAIGAGGGQLARTNYRSAMKGIDASGRNSQKLQQQYGVMRDGAIKAFGDSKDDVALRYLNTMRGGRLGGVHGAEKQRMLTLAGGTAAAGLGATGIAAAASPSERR